MKFDVKKTLASLVVVSGLVFAGCSSDTASTPTAEPGVVQEMSGAELNGLQADNDAKDDVLVIDVRPADAYAEGHIKHAINFPLEEIEGNLDRIAHYKEKPVIVYCNTDNMSSQASEILIDNGFTNVTIADGMKDHEYTTTSTYESYLPEEFAAGTEEDAVYVDVREQEDFETSSFPDALSADPENPEAVLENLPEDRSTPIYVFCYSGNRSSSVAQAISDAGYENVYNALEGTKEYEYKLAEK